MTNTDTAATLATLKIRAALQVAQYPQYAEHFASYRLAVVKRDIRTKMGLAFTKGEFVIVSPDEPMRVAGATLFRSAWSMRNKIDTSIKASDLEFVA